MTKSVVYAIKNNENSKMYIGSTVDFPKRKREHLNSLRNNKHHSIHLQKSWNKYGENAFVFIILEEVKDVNALRIIEREWIDKVNSLKSNFGYNVSESTLNFSASGENHPLFRKDRNKLGHVNYWKGKTIPEHIRLKMRKPRSEEAKQNMSINHADVNGENNPMYGKKFTEEHKKKISKSLIGKMVGSKNPMYGRKRSGENAGNRKKVLQLSLDGEILNEFINITEASKETGAIRQHISKCCKGERKQTGGYKWVYAN